LAETEKKGAGEGEGKETLASGLISCMETFQILFNRTSLPALRSLKTRLTDQLESPAEAPGRRGMAAGQGGEGLEL